MSDNVPSIGTHDAMLPLLIPLPGRAAAHDLPPRWDGRKVTWQPWREQPLVFLCGPRASGRTHCTSCRTSQPRMTCSGTVSGEDTYPVRRLFAYRCSGCGQDTVVELAPQGMQVWELDDSDYGDAGSFDPAPHAYDH